MFASKSGFGDFGRGFSLKSMLNPFTANAMLLAAAKKKVVPIVKKSIVAPIKLTANINKAIVAKAKPIIKKNIAANKRVLAATTKPSAMLAAKLGQKNPRLASMLMPLETRQLQIEQQKQQKQQNLYDAMTPVSKQNETVIYQDENGKQITEAEYNDQMNAYSQGQDTTPTYEEQSYPEYTEQQYPAEQTEEQYDAYDTEQNYTEQPYNQSDEGYYEESPYDNRGMNESEYYRNTDGSEEVYQPYISYEQEYQNEGYENPPMYTEDFNELSGFGDIQEILKDAYNTKIKPSALNYLSNKIQARADKANEGQSQAVQEENKIPTSVIVLGGLLAVGIAYSIFNKPSRRK